MSLAHTPYGAPSNWLVRFAPLITAGGEVLDYACGSGRHARWLASRGYRVEAADRDAPALELLDGVHNIRPQRVDLEQGPWPYGGRGFDAVVMTNYLFRPRFAMMLELIVPGGVLIAETFMVGNERFGKPSNPDFLLQPGELLQRVGDGFSVVAFEQGEVDSPKAAVVQRICAVRGNATTILPAARG